jgi:hypothetical protein
VAGSILLALVGARGWFGNQRLAGLEARADKFTPNTYVTRAVNRSIPIVSESNEEIQLVTDLIQTRARLREGPIGAAFALAMIVTGLTRLRSNRAPVRSTNWGWARWSPEPLVDALGITLTVLLGLGYGFSLAVILWKGAPFSPELLDLAFSRTMQAFLAAADALLGG